MYVLRSRALGSQSLVLFRRPGACKDLLCSTQPALAPGRPQQSAPCLPPRSSAQQRGGVSRPPWPPRASTEVGTAAPFSRHPEAFEVSQYPQWYFSRPPWAEPALSSGPALSLASARGRGGGGRGASLGRGSAGLRCGAEGSRRGQRPRSAEEEHLPVAWEKWVSSCFPGCLAGFRLDFALLVLLAISWPSPPVLAVWAAGVLRALCRGIKLFCSPSPWYSALSFLLSFSSFPSLPFFSSFSLFFSNISCHKPLGSCYTHIYRGLSVISLLNLLSMHAPSRDPSSAHATPEVPLSLSVATQHAFLLIGYERYFMMWRWNRVSYGERILLSAVMFPWLLSSSGHICGKIEEVHGVQRATGIDTKSNNVLPHLAALLGGVHMVNQNLMHSLLLGTVLP